MSMSMTMNMNTQYESRYNNIYSSLKEYMFYDNIIKKNNKLLNAITELHANTQLTKTHKRCKEEKSDLVPYEKDNLFWCFFLLVNNEYEYKLIKDKHFTIEKKWKMDILDKLKEKENLDFLKSKKIKLIDIQDEIMNNETISMKVFDVLCKMYNLSVVYVSGKKYCEFMYDNDIVDDSEEEKYKKIKVLNVMNDKGNRCGFIKRSEKEQIDYLNNVYKTYWKIDNISKPLKSASSYSYAELKDICNKMEIPLEDSVTKKKKTMKILYQELLAKM